jgi:hypothetical protein
MWCGGAVVYSEMMARRLEPALRDLVEVCRLRERDRYDWGPLFEATVSVGGDDDATYARVALWRPTGGEPARVHVWGWVVNRDLARYIGGNPPAEHDVEVLRLRGPVQPRGDDLEAAGFSARIARHLCDLVGGTGFGVDEGLPHFNLEV